MLAGTAEPIIVQVMDNLDHVAETNGATRRRGGAGRIIPYLTDADVVSSGLKNETAPPPNVKQHRYQIEPP